MIKAQPGFDIGGENCVNEKDASPGSFVMPRTKGRTRGRALLNYVALRQVRAIRNAGMAFAMANLGLGMS
jgi:hypothetical protein